LGTGFWVEIQGEGYSLCSREWVVTLPLTRTPPTARFIQEDDGKRKRAGQGRIVVPRRHVMIMETAGHCSFWGAEIFFLFRAALCRRLAFHLFQR
ncbi:MAG: hypothetical protein MSH25_02860, partial [Desulfovibrio sp.]|nr:hypothetical protein [Desulfovibrio sp.]